MQDPREQVLCTERIQSRVVPEQLLQFGKAAVGVKGTFGEIKNHAGIGKAEIIRISDNAVEAVELAGDNAKLRAG